MKQINQSYEILGTPKSLDEAWGFVAKAARTCYQSTKTKLDESEEDFCKRLLLKHTDDVDKNHMSPFEFGVIYLTFTGTSTECAELAKRYSLNKYSRVEYEVNSPETMFIGKIPAETPITLYITANLRTIIENHWENDLQYICEPTEHHQKFWIFKLTTCLHVYKDIRTHRTLSFNVESTRFCNYLKDKFGASITFVKLPWVTPEEEEEVMKDLEYYEQTYFKWIKRGWTAQQAAEFLPQCVKGEVMFGGFEDNLKHMFKLRAEECSGPVHPLVKEVIKPLYKDYLKFIEK